MSDAIALSSPSGRMSKRASVQADKRLGGALFGDYDPNIPHVPTNNERAKAMRQSAQNMRDLAARGMSPRKMLKQAEALETRARFLAACGVEESK